MGCLTICATQTVKSTGHWGPPGAILVALVHAFGSAIWGSSLMKWGGPWLKEFLSAPIQLDLSYVRYQHYDYVRITKAS